MSITNLSVILSANNRQKSVKVTAQQISPEDFKLWTGAVAQLHEVAYKVYSAREDQGLRDENSAVDLTPVYEKLRTVLSLIGEVNGSRLFASADSVNQVIAKSGNPNGNKDSEALLSLISEYNAENAVLRTYQKYNGVSAETITAKETQVEDLKTRIAALKKVDGNRIAQPKPVSPNVFRLEVEHMLARAIDEQNAKTWEEVQAEIAERKAARNKKANQRKKDKRAREAATASATTTEQTNA